MAAQSQTQHGNPLADAIAQPQPQLSARIARPSLSALLEKVLESSDAQGYARQMIDAEIARDVFDQDWRLARVFAMSGAFSEMKNLTEEQAISLAMAKIRMGRSWGITEADAMQFVYFTNGKPAVMNELVASTMRKIGYDWDVDWIEGEDPKQKARKVCIGCRIWLKKYDQKSGEYLPVRDRAGQPISEAFTKEDADRAMIWEKGKEIPLSEKWNFVSWAKDMYFWRTIARIKRFHVTNVFAGAYLQVEADDMSGGADETPRTSRRTEQPSGSREAQTAVLARRLAEEAAPTPQRQQETASASKPAADDEDEAPVTETPATEPSQSTGAAAATDDKSVDSSSASASAQQSNTAAPKPNFSFRGKH